MKESWREINGSWAEGWVEGAPNTDKYTSQVIVSHAIVLAVTLNSELHILFANSANNKLCFKIFNVQNQN